MRSYMMVGVVGPLVAAAAIACQHASRTPPVAIEPVSVAGIVSVTGTAFEQHIVLRSGQVVIPLSATTSDSAALSRVGGVQVDVVGRWGPNLSFRVESFTAAYVEGLPVVDGVVRKDGGRLLLETTHGLVPLGNPPTVLRGMIGARIWIGGPLDTGPNTYGVIVPAK